MPDGIGQMLLCILTRIGVEKALILVDGARDYVKIEFLRVARPVVHEELQALRISIGKPFVDGEAIALRLRNLLALLVEEQFVVEALRRLAAEGCANLA